jgi:hypothetical protein
MVIAPFAYDLPQELEVAAQQVDCAMVFQLD